jgi:hypothetical protein
MCLIGGWLVEVADVAARADKWCDTAIYFGPATQVALLLPEESEIVETNWPATVSRFGPAQREDTDAACAPGHRTCEASLPGSSCGIAGTTYEGKYRKAAQRLARDRRALLAFDDFPA